MSANLALVVVGSAIVALVIVQMPPEERPRFKDFAPALVLIGGFMALLGTVVTFLKVFGP